MGNMENVIVKLDNCKGCVQNYSIVISAFIRENKVTGHLRPKLTINWSTLKITNISNHSEQFALKGEYSLTISQANCLRKISKDKYCCYPIVINSDMFYYIAIICDNKCESTVTNNAAAPPAEEKDETHTRSLYPSLKLLSD